MGRLLRKISFYFFFLFILEGCTGIFQAERYFKKARLLESRAESIYRAYLKKFPAQKSLVIRLAWMYYQKGRFEEALELIKNIEKEPVYKLKAMIYSRLQRYTEALEYFRKIKEDKDSEFLYLYGLTLEEKNLFTQAILKFQAVKDSPYREKATKRLFLLENLVKEENLPDYLEGLIKKAPSEEDFPDASSVILFCKETKEITRENTSIFTIHMIVKILNDRGREKWGEVELDYDSTYQRLELEFARTITPEGKIIYAGRKNIRDVARYLNFPLYSNVRARIISMPEVLAGSIIEYKARIYNSRLINDKDFSIIYYLKESDPISLATFKLILPEEREVNFLTLNRKYLPQGISLKPEVFQEEDKKIYLWKFKDIPQLLPEDNMVPPSFVNPAIVISSFSSWDEFYQWWKKLGDVLKFL